MQAKITPLPASTLVEFRGVSKRYHIYKRRIFRTLDAIGIGKFLRSDRHGYLGIKNALDDVSLKISPGERIGIIGRNGSGKTTLLKLVIGIIQPTSGVVSLNTRPQALMDSVPVFKEELTGMQNILDELYINGFTGSKSTGMVAEILDFSELKDFIFHPVRTYSRGMRMRLEFATATAISPELLVIDEMLNAGDGYFATRCAQRLRNLINSTTLLLVSHSMEQVMEYCNRVIWVDNGQVIQDGDCLAVVSAYRKYMSRYSAGLSALSPVNSVDQVNRAVTIESGQETGSGIYEISVRQLQHRLSKNHPDELIKFKSVTYADNEQTNLLVETGGRLAVRMVIEFSEKWSRPFVPVIFAFSDSGILLWDASGEEVTIDGTSALNEIDMTVECSNFISGTGSFELSIGLQEAGDSVPRSIDSILCVLHSCLSLTVLPSNYSDPPLFHCPAMWQYGGEGSPVFPARISSSV